jgi:hypothetical protein
VTARLVLADFPAGGPRGSWPAEEKAQQLRDSGQPVVVRMDLAGDRFIVVPAETGER